MKNKHLKNKLLNSSIDTNIYNGVVMWYISRVFKILYDIYTHLYFHWWF